MAAFLHKEDGGGGGGGGGGGEDLNIDTHSDAPARYVSLDRVYSAAASLCVSSSNVMSKKVKARKLILKRNGEPDPPILKVYSRRPKPHNQCAGLEAKDHDDEESLQKTHKRKRMGCGELVKLGVDSTVLSELHKPRLRDCRNNCNVENGGAKKRNRKHVKNSTLSGPPDKKQWALLNLEGADPKALIGLRCQVFWPLDADWYSGKVVGYNADTFRHHVQYDDGDTENLIICKEKIRFYISKEELEKLNLKLSDDCDHNDSETMVVMAASLNDCQEFEAGDIVWAKLTGHAMWPAIIVDEAVIRDRPGLNKVSGERSVPVQFFGTHDFARIRVKQMMSFLNGLLSSLHQKCRKQKFTRSIQEAKVYLSEQRLPKRMRLLQKGVNASGSDCYSTDDERWSDADERHTKGLMSQKPDRTNGESPFVTEELQILSLGKIVNDSDHFRDDRFVWPEGYTALRKFTSFTDPNIRSFYKMEVLRDPQLKDRPLFRVTLDSGEQIEGSDPSACWNKVYKRIRAIHSTSDGAEFEGQGGYLSGSDMFGFSNPDVVKLIKGLAKSKLHSEASTRKGISGRNKDLTVGYRPVRVDWKDLDKCSVCHMDEEYENNLFLQCDKCRMMVHARCYGEHESVDGVLWLCNLCRPGAPESPPPCCLCPVIGGAMKPTTDGHWAHLSCAIWIPETCLSDVKRMEPIDGIDRISKDRWKLLCSICGVYYGACIQCSNHSCRVAYHPLCARAAGLCVELEDEDRILLLSVDDDDTEDQCIRLLSFCKRHRQPSHERSTTDEVISRTVHKCSDYRPPLNPSGCARSEPYNHIGRRGRKEPEALSAAFLKRLFVENRPHVVAGHSHHGLSGSMLLHKRVSGLRFTSRVHNIRGSQDDTLHNILSVAEKYKYMRETFRKRLVFGKSGIHGFGIFAKHSHRAGDMVIEYTGELVRPSIADRREHQIYNSLVGAGTYMFRIDDERVIDATRAGSIAHLINHSCEPNCYSRVICVNGDNHIIIFAKRDIKRWEELTYDYRFFSIDEHLACYCGFPRCRGVVNDMEAGERLARITVPRSELVDWTGE